MKDLFIQAKNRGQQLFPSSSQKFQIGMGSMEKGLVDLSIRVSGASFVSLQVSMKTTAHPITKQQLEETLHKVQNVYHPLFRCKVVRDPLETFMYEHLPNSVIPVHVHSSGKKAKDLFQTNLQRSQLQALPDNLHHVSLFNHSTGGQDIVFNLEHVVIDGSSLTHFLHVFFTLLTNPQAQIPPVQMEVPSNLACKQALHLTNWQLWSKQAWLGMKMLQVTLFTKVINLPRNPASQQLRAKDLPNLSTTLEFTITLSLEETKQLKLNCKLNESTITSAVIEVYAKAIKEHAPIKGGSTHALIVSNIRPLVNISKEALTPYLGTVDFYSKDQCIAKWHMAKEASTVIKAVKPQDMLVRSLMNAHLGKGLPSSHFLPTFTISSWGAQSPLRNEYPYLKIEQVQVYQNYNFFYGAPCISVYPMDPQGKQLRITMFGTVPFFTKEKLLLVHLRAQDILKQDMCAVS
jgi:hypothetical protein